MRAGFGMDGHPVASGLGKGLEIGIGRRNHQVAVEGLVGGAAQRADDVGPEGDIGDEVAVHHVEMDPVGTGCRDIPHLVSQAGEIGSEDRRAIVMGSDMNSLR